MIKRFLFISLLFLASQSMAQFYQTGVEPFGTKWRQIRTDNFRILFPAEAEKMAFRYANLLSVIDSVAPKSLGAKQKIFDVVIHNHSTLSNGFVIWAPKRMEIIAQPPSTTSPQPWLTQLALHETRHTSQLFKLNSGIVKPASILFGELSIGGASGFVPLWFLEGDAVAFETATSNAGRGRQADFYQYYRAHYLSKTKSFRYDKWLMGSYRDNIPNHYNFGYQLVSYAKAEYGNQVWANTLQYVSRYPFTLFPFYFGFKKETGLSRNQLFKKAFSGLDSLWKFNQKSQGFVNYQQLTKQGEEYTEYRYPYLLSDSLLIAYKANLSETPRFVLIDLKTKKEEALVSTGSLMSIPSYFNEHIFWAEYCPHIRWEYKNYSIIKWYNTKTAKVKKVSDRGRYFSPVYNSNDGLIYAISGLDDGSNAIVTFNLNGEKKNSILLPNEYQPFELTLNDKQEMICGVVSDKGKAIVRVNHDGTCDLIYGPTYLDIHSISSKGDLLLFSTTEGYKEDIFAFNIQTKEITRITNSAFGATDPLYLSKSNGIVFSNYTSNGYSISTANIDTASAPIILNSINDDFLTTRLRSTENFNIDSVEMPNRIYDIKKYRGIKTMANIHSWTPFYFDINQLIAGEVNIKLGAMVYSQNLTGTSVLTAGYGYDKTHLTRVSYQYFGFFPVFSYEFEMSGFAPSVYYIENTEIPITDKQRKESTLSIYLPLKFSMNSFSTVLYPFVTILRTNDYFLSVNDSLYHKGFQRFNYRIFFSTLQKQALKNVRPRLGFSADINYENAPFNRNNLGSIASASFLLYLPGIGKTHSLLIKNSLQQQRVKRYYLPNKILFPRGYPSYYSDKFSSLSVDYLMPIAYPDLAVGSLAYLKRISLNSFFDYAVMEYPTKTGKQLYRMKSFGFELFTDLNLLRTRYPIRFKFQQGWAGDNLRPFNSFTMAIDFYGQ
ncbi:MAG: hypothetical protein EHM93_01680 [Bacteroidales bacterium]|nr:MAG: hypothetical protein EHM93_01680 [Bacteroidales bacterium]